MTKIPPEEEEKKKWETKNRAKTKEKKRLVLAELKRTTAVNFKENNDWTEKKKLFVKIYLENSEFV